MPRKKPEPPTLFNVPDEAVEEMAIMMADIKPGDGFIVPSDDAPEVEAEQAEAEPDPAQADVSIKPDEDTHLAILVRAYASGATVLDAAGNEVSARRVASEIVGKYRAKGKCLKDKDKGVSYDGSLYADILLALEAAERRGRNTEL
jgi:hypothetical protein